MICVLKVLRGPTNRSSRYVLRENQHVEIGRSTSADISLPSDAHLSRRHVLVDSFGDGFSICDLGSANGTYLNDQRIRRAALKHGDVIRIGMTQFRVSMMEDDANPHAEDGVLFSSSVGQDMESIREVNERRERSVTFPNTMLDEETTRCVPQAAIQAELQRNFLHAESGFAPSPDRRFDSSSQPKPLNAGTVTRESSKESTTISRTPPPPIAPFSEYFRGCEQPNLYTLQHHLDSPRGDFVGLLLMRADKDRLLSVFNVTQVQSQEAALLEQRRRDNRLFPISKTILAGNLSVSDADLGLLFACTACDGLLCIGSSQRIDPEELKPFANSFSYPSLFGEHIKDVKSPLRDFLVGRQAWVLFEWSRKGPIGLFA